jgi:2-polyprenyl-6-methoxyphenol hydroxylase-like FAD-dependent oxidoreductase
VLDRDDLPDDMQASTHLVWPAGTACLGRWGLLDRLDGTGCRPMEHCLLDLGGLVLRGTPPPADGETRAFGPRRFVLDAMLLNAAQEAGATLRTGCSFDGVIESDGVVTGVRFTDAAGQPVEAHASIVVGADGRTSAVADAVNADVLEEHPRHQGTIWAYFDDLPIDGMEFHPRPGRMVYAWYTSGNQTLAGICFRYDDYVPVARDTETRMAAEFASLTPDFAERLGRARRASDWLAGATKGFMRRATGPGWALVGDAGITMDPITAAGITNSFRDAERLSQAIHDGLSGARPIADALREFEADRNAASAQLYAFARDMSRLDPPDQTIIDLFTAMAGNQAATDSYFGIFAQTVPVSEFFAPDNVARIIESSGAAAGPGG